MLENLKLDEGPKEDSEEDKEDEDEDAIDEESNEEEEKKEWTPLIKQVLLERLISKYKTIANNDRYWKACDSIQKKFIRPGLLGPATRV